MDARNFTFMFYGFAAAWIIVLLYVISLARRGARLKKELEQVKRLFDTAPEERAESSRRVAERVG
jgi:CcmD family protein